MYVNRSKMSEKRIICTDFGISFPISFKFRRHSLLFHAALIAHSGFFAGALIGGGYSIFAHGETCNFSEISGKGSSRAISHTLPYSLSRIIGIFRRVKASASLSDAAAVNERGEGAAAMTANDLRKSLGMPSNHPGESGQGEVGAEHSVRSHYPVDVSGNGS